MFGTSTLIVFDFDWSLINENSDTYIIKKLKPELYNYMKTLMSGEYEDRWTALMDHMMFKLHENGVTKKDISDCLKEIPFFKEMFEGVEFCHKAECELVIVSDANSFFINEILTHHSLKESFTQVVTNSANFEEENGPLKVFPHQSPSSPHNCRLCPINMCKGAIFDSLRKPSHQQVIYIGDGGGDLCPCLRLQKSDIACIRKDFSLHKMINKNPEQFTPIAEIVIWENGVDVFDLFKKKIISSKSSKI